jgi:16S rRNA G966 N2-methylase RsmD
MLVNRLILGDNLEILKGMEADSVDLIYLDPPFSALCAGLPLSPRGNSRP